MLRALVYFAVLAVAVWGAVSLADHPGTVTLEWGGWRVDTSFAVLLGAVAVVAVASALVYRFWTFLRRAPGQIMWAWRTRRRQRGYQALTRGMVAVAAGDADEAKRQAKRADALLNEPPLTMLVSAQAAQMNGDEKAATTFFTAMMEKPETEFLGLRGLLTQALKEGDTERALELARRAYRLQPKSAWVAATLFDLQSRTGQWLDARVTCDDLERRKLIDGPEARRRRAVLGYRAGLDALASGDGEAAQYRFAQAHKLEPGFVPVTLDLARQLIRADKPGRAAGVIEDTWARAPHPDLVEPYWQGRGADGALERVKVTERLAKRNPDHPESHVALARAGLEARLWGEARKHLDAALKMANPPPQRLCRMMAALEESEHDDAVRAREWLMRAANAPADAAWVCDRCGNTVHEWSVICAKCDTFDGFAWRTPPSVEGPGGHALTEHAAGPRLPAVEPG